VKPTEKSAAKIPGGKKLRIPKAGTGADVAREIQLVLAEEDFEQRRMISARCLNPHLDKRT
jgi:hypothetical protein